MLHKKHKHDIVVILAVLGAGISLYLAVSHYLGVAVPCTVTHGCETVLASKYSSFFGLPLSVWGVLFYAGAIVTALLANHYVLWRRLLTLLLGLGALMSLIFLGLQFFVIRQICQYCLTTDVLAVVLLLLDLNIEYRQS